MVVQWTDVDLGHVLRTGDDEGTVEALQALLPALRYLATLDMATNLMSAYDLLHNDTLSL